MDQREFFCTGLVDNVDTVAVDERSQELRLHQEEKETLTIISR
jgi:hypothetical protein